MKIKKENTKEATTKKKKQIKIICYISLVVLPILLVLPPVLRIFVVEKEEKKKDEVIIVNCNNENGSINSTFLNGVPQNIRYDVKGNLLENSNADEAMVNETVTSNTEISTTESTTIDENKTTETTTDNNIDSSIITENISGNTMDKSFVELIIDYAAPSYDESTDITTLSIPVSNLETLPEYQTIFKSVELQERYYASKGFTCSVKTLA